ncbi:hypothetical protein SUDANB32_00405 [Streptomyces sp. enrichment culture]
MRPSVSRRARLRSSVRPAGSVFRARRAPGKPFDAHESRGGPLGGLFEAVDDDTAAGALEAAWDSGIRYFDTSPHYGIGQSERRIGALLRGRPRDAWTLSTKVGRVLVPQDGAGRKDEAFEVPASHRRVWDFTRDGVLRSVEDSLTRMGVD